MSETEIIEERISLAGKNLTLAGVIAYPASAEPVRSVLLCSPHPHFAGDMDNNIIRAISRDLAKDSVTLRFDYRGVGNSRIELPPGLSVFDYWEEVEQQKEYEDALADVASAAQELSDSTSGLPMIVVGYSLGAVTGLRFGMNDVNTELVIGISPPWIRIKFDFVVDCPKPVLLLSAENDFLYSQQEIDRLRDIVGSTVIIETLKTGDHFFRGEENIICKHVRSFIQNIPGEKRCHLM